MSSRPDGVRLTEFVPLGSFEKSLSREAARQFYRDPKGAPGADGRHERPVDTTCLHLAETLARRPAASATKVFHVEERSSGRPIVGCVRPWLIVIASLRLVHGEDVD